MGVIRFNDGVSFDTSGSLRLERRHDGWYVVGGGTLVAVTDEVEGRKFIDEEIERGSQRDELCYR